MRIGNNISAMNTLNRLTVNNSQLSKSLEKLSSGSAINRASDDAAGLAISEKMRAQIAGLEQASKNAQDGISLVQTAEGALDQTHTALRRMYTLAEKAKNGTITAEDRNKIQSEINARIEEIDRVADTANFNGIKLFDGSLQDGLAAAAPATGTVNGDAATISSIAFGSDATTPELKDQLIKALSGSVTFTVEDDGTAADVTSGDFTYSYDNSAKTITVTDADSNELGVVTLSAAFTTPSSGNTTDVAIGGFTGGNATGKALNLQIGATSAGADSIAVSINDMHADQLLTLSTVGGVQTLDMTTVDAASSAMDSINTAIERVSTQRANLGAVQNRLDQTIENLSTTAENMSAAESRIRDVDMAKEMTNFTKYSILSQASQAMLAQANALPQGVLQLLG